METPTSLVEGAPSRPSPNSGQRGQRELPVRETSPFRRTREGHAHILGSQLLPHIYNSDEPGTDRPPPESGSSRTVWKPQPRWLTADWLGFAEPAPPGEDMESSPCHKSFNAHTTRISRGRKQVPPWSIPVPCGVITPTPLMNAEPAPRGEDVAPSPDHQPFLTYTAPTKQGRKRWYPGSVVPRTAGNFQLERLIR